MAGSKRRKRMNAKAFAQLVSALIEIDTLTYEELSEHTGLSVDTVEQYVKELRAAKLCHVCDKLPNALGQRRVFVIKWGKGKDYVAKRETNAARLRRYRRQKKEAPVNSVFALAR